MMKLFCKHVVLATALTVTLLFGMGNPRASRANSDSVSTENIPYNLIPYQVKGQVDYAIVVDKENQALSLYCHEKKDTFKQLFKMNCSTGKAVGDKTVSGDSKTPEGVYFFTKIFEDSELSPIYGIRAYPLDYPNIRDRNRGKTGNAIWLHGTNKPLKPRDSNGCIVLENENLQKLKNYIRLFETPIIIVDKLVYQPPDYDLEKQVEQLFTNLSAAMSFDSYHAFLNHYDAAYLPDLSWWMDWLKMRNKAKTDENPFSIKMENISIFRHKKEIVVALDQNLESFEIGSRHVGRKSVFLIHRDGKLKIIDESFQNMQADENSKADAHPLITAAKMLYLADRYPREQISSMIDNWIQAWSSKDIDAYGIHYASDFQSKGMDKNEWLSYKTELNRKYNQIHVSRKKLLFKGDPIQPVVSFVQRYESTGYTATGIKKLVLKQENGAWKIYRELWRQM